MLWENEILLEFPYGPRDSTSIYLLKLTEILGLKFKGKKRFQPATSMTAFKKNIIWQLVGFILDRFLAALVVNTTIVHIDVVPFWKNQGATRLEEDFPKLGAPFQVA